jgi:hypothetical protein
VALAFCARPVASLAAQGSGPARTKGAAEPASETAIPAQGEGVPAPEPVAIPAPSFLVAEPTPNDNGTRITVRWPRLPSDREEEAAKAKWRYVVYIGVDPSWRWFECGALGADEGLITGEDISPFYPYRFSDGTEHFFIVSPLEVPGIAIHWLPAEKQSLDWLEGSRAALQQCESSLAVLKKTIEERELFIEKVARYRPVWEEKAKEQANAGTVFAWYLKSADKRERDLTEAIAAGRDGILDNLARYLLLNALIGAEVENAVRAMRAADLPDIERQLRDAEEAIRAEGATADRYDDYDRLSYARSLALIREAEADVAATAEKIVQEVLWRLDDLLRQAQLPPDLAKLGVQAESEAETDNAALAEALIDWHAALAKFERDSGPEAEKQWAEAQAGLDQAMRQWQGAMRSTVSTRLGAGKSVPPERDYLRPEISRLRPVVDACAARFRLMRKENERRPYCFRLGLATPTGERTKPFAFVASAAARPSLFDMSKLVNFIYAIGFTGAVLLMVVYVRHHPDVFVRRIPGLEAVDEAIGRATEMGKPVLFVHGLTGVGDIAVLASINILGRLARQIAAYDSDLLVVNNDALVYSLSQEVVQEAYLEAGRPDAYNPDNVFMVASDQFPYVAAVAGIMSRRQPAANFFMGYFFAESLILAETGAMTGAIQIAGTDSFTQLPFFITTCDYTLMGEELYAASAYLSRNARLLATLKAQDLGKSVLLAALPVGMGLSNLGLTWVKVIFTAYEKGF